ncbi:Branched-chain amino acid ABC transporter, amino acid-binding protein [Desulfovibrio sp. DV]|uniref:ABC transporter substrate-binding protein n=1 Tax=Desulfovibrio sp. DV TaxID=1844708 RepID=UPI00094BB722|nr:ABC transporter substrate-binding protein [Desulfovibrio sp. DV]OLN29662.1 Branched-chain amino acid ABC transporter, amino acid-binding protein [Desulfovibrio sp. DV]
MPKRRRPSLPALLAALALGTGLLAIAGCFGRKTPELRLGFIATFSGEDFRTGRDALEAARFAVDAANAAGQPRINGTPCQVRLFIADDKDSPEEAARAVKKLVEKDGVTAIIGPYASTQADAAALAAESLGIPLIAPSSTAAVVTAGRPHIFRIAFTDAFQGTVLGRLASRELGLTRVAIIANEDDLSSQSLTAAFAQAFTACGGSPSVFFYEDRTRQFGAVLGQALAGAPQGLLLPVPGKEAVLLGLAARKAGFTGILMGGDTWDGPEVSRLAAFDGAYFVDHWRQEAPGTRAAAYSAAFARDGKRQPTELGALTQDAVDVLVAAATRAGSVEPKALTQALLELPPHDGVTGTFDFIDDGNPVKSLYISRVAGGGSRLDTIEAPPPQPCIQ